MSNPFVEQLGVYNAGYVTGGVLMIISEIIMLALVSKHSDGPRPCVFLSLCLCALSLCLSVSVSVAELCARTQLY